MLTAEEQRVLGTFKRFLMTPGQMLCFNGPTLKKNKTALQKLTDRSFLISEQFKGAYSLTHDGFDAMNSYAKISRSAKKD